MKKNLLMVQMSLDIGGAETHIVELALELQRRGYRVVIASNGGAYVEELERAGVIHYQVPLHNKNPKNMLVSYFLLRDILRKEKIELVHAHARIPAFLVGKLCRKMHIPFVTTAHWVFATGFGLKYLTDWGEQTVAVSEDIRDYLIKNYHTDPSHIYVTINGINTQKFSEEIDTTGIRQEFGLSDSAFRIVHISRIDYSRELVSFLLVRSVESLLPTIPDLELVIVGGGDAFSALQKEAEEVNRRVGRRVIVLTGPRIDINRFTAVADLFVGASRAALEAMAAHKATVVAGNEGDMGLYSADKQELAFSNNFTCRGADLPTTDSLTKSILEFYQASAEQKTAWADVCQRTVYEHYSVQKMADDTERAYQAALERE